jgi:hypothetical protein
MSHAAPPPGIAEHIRHWFESDVKPDLDDLKNVAGQVRKLAPEVAVIASLAVKLAEAADPAAAPEVALLADGAKEAAQVIEAIAAALAASGM